MEQLLKNLNTDDSLKTEIITQVNELEHSDKSFIDKQATKIISLIEKKPNIFTDNTFELNAIRLYLVRTLPDVSDKIIDLLKNFNERLEISNELLSKRFEKKLKQKYEETVTVYDKPVSNIKEVDIRTGLTQVDALSNMTDDKVVSLMLDNFGKNPIEFAKEYLQQEGGAEPTLDKISKTQHFLKKLREIYNIFNTDILLKLLGLMSYENEFNKIYKILFQSDKSITHKQNFIDIFFFNINNYNNLVRLLNGTKINDYINRDTYIYNKIVSNNDNNKYILIYSLLHLIVNHKYSSIISTDDNIKELIKLIINCSIRIREIKKLYKHFKDNINLINIEYNKLINKNKRVYTFIRERKDTNTTNPRYKIRLQTQESDKTNTINNDYLLVKYYNTDEKINYQGTYNPENTEEYFKDKLNPEYYYFGPFDGIYTTASFQNNSSVSEKAGPILIEKLTNGQDICVIGYGQSGSGKTSSLIYLSSKQQDGILIEICKHKTFTDYFAEIKLKAKNIYINFNEGRTNMESIGPEDYKDVDINFNKSSTEATKINEITFTYDQLWKSGNNNLGDMINHAFEQREVEPTPNNPNSSRSHIIVCLTLTPKEVDGKRPEPRKLIVCDLAGVENVFNCENPEEIFKFDERYNISDKYGKEKEVEFDNYYCKQKETNTQTDIKLFDDYNKNMELIKGYSKNIKEYDEIIFNLLDKFENLINDFIEDTESKIMNLNEKISNKGGIETINTSLNNKREKLKDFNDFITLIDTHKDKLKDLYTRPQLNDIISKFQKIYNINIPYEDAQKKNANESTQKKYPSTGKNTQYNIIVIKNYRDELEKEIEEETKLNSDDLTNQLAQFNKLQILLKSKPSEDQQKGGATKCDQSSPLINCSRKFELWEKHKGKIDTIINNINSYNSKIILIYENFDLYLKKLNGGELTEDETKKLNLLFQSDTQQEIQPNTSIQPTQTKQAKTKQHKGGVTDSNSDKGEDKDKNKIKNRLKTELIQYMDLLNNYKSWCCEHTRYLKLTHNCKLRRFEGYMINKSLSDMRVDIKSLIKQAIQIGDSPNKFLPIFFDKQILPYCRNINYEDDTISSFYKQPDSGGKTVNGKIIETMKGFGVNLEQIVFAIFTVINLTDNGKVNNPPNPPYINLNNLIYNLEINFNLEKLIEEINIIHNLVQKYNFYQNNDTMEKLKEEKDNIIKSNDVSGIKSHANRIIDLIKANNAATLIGSLESTDVLQNITYDKLVCSHNEKLSHLLRKFKGMELQQVINYTDIGNLNSSISNKYLKRYKINY